MSLLDQQSTPISLLVGDNENPVDFDDAIGILEAFSFVSVDETGTICSMHRLVQAATRAWRWDQEDCISKDIASQVVQILSSRFPDGEFQTWKARAQYLPHAESVLSRFGGQSEPDDLTRAKLLCSIGGYLRKQGNHPLAKLKARESLDIYHAMGKPDCAGALQSSTESAAITKEAGGPEGAIKLYQETLKLQENLLGEDHRDTLETVDGLALALVELGANCDDHKEAGLLARRALVGGRKRYRRINRKY